MSRSPEDTYFYIPAVVTMIGGGTLALAWTLPAIQNNAPHAVAPLLFVEGLGLSLLGAGKIVYLKAKASPREKLRASGITLLGLGLGVLGITDMLTIDRTVPLIAGTALLLSGAVATGLAEDSGNLMNWD